VRSRIAFYYQPGAAAGIVIPELFVLAGRVIALVYVFVIRGRCIFCIRLRAITQ
jgi:hypothetical protein